MIFDFSEIKRDELAIAGGKGANLGELTAAGMNVPKGFVITTECYGQFLKANGLDRFIEGELKAAGGDEKKLLKAAGEIREKIKGSRFPEHLKTLIEKKYLDLGEEVPVAVRSSSTAEDLPDASFAGQQETYLNIRGAERVLDALRNCYASLWGDRAVSYRLNHGYGRTSVFIAVVVQVMVESEKAGVLFTVNPVSKKQNEMQINASFGLGESVVAGRVTADSYVTDKSGEILEVTVGSKATQIVYVPGGTAEVPVSPRKRSTRVLSDGEVRKLVACGVAIEKHYGMPMDIEWAIQGDVVYILQARAITTLRKSGVEVFHDDLIGEYIKNKRIGRSTKEVMAFLLEKMPFPYRALDFDFLRAIDEQKVNIFSEGGIVLPPNPVIDDDGIQFFSDRRSRVNKNIFRIFGLLKTLGDFDFCYRKCVRFMSVYQSKIEEIRHLHFETLTLAECGKFLEESYGLLQNLAYDRFKYALFPSIWSSRKFTRIVRRVNRACSAFDLYGGSDYKTAVITRRIHRMVGELRKQEGFKQAIHSGEGFGALYERFSLFRRLADEFMEENGFKSDYNCSCLSAKTFIEEPDRLVDLLRPLVNADEESEAPGGTKDFSRLMQSLKELYGRSYPALEERIRIFRYFHLVREESQYLWETLFYYLRKAVRRINLILLGDENYDSGVANLFYSELMAAVRRGELDAFDREKMDRRNEKFPLAVKVWDASRLLIFKARGPVLKGVSGSAGVAVGPARVITGPGEFYKMKKGDILVCPFTDPEWTPLFKLAQGVVADTGSALSHAAIVAREYHIPAVLAVGFGTEKFKDGDKVRVDGNRGEVGVCSDERKVCPE